MVATRREVIAGAGAVLATGSAVSLAGCATKRPLTVVKPPKISRSASEQDVQVLNTLLDVEHRAVAAYEIGVPLLNGPAQAAVSHFLGQDLAHANELSALVARHGGVPNQPEPTYDFGNPTNASELLTVFAGLERTQVSSYLGCIPLVAPGPLRATLATMMGSDAQHITVLHRLLGQPPLDGAFVTGVGS